MGTQIQWLHLPQCESTNQYLLDHPQLFQTNQWLAVHTFHQTAGKGRMGKRWQSSPQQTLTLSLGIVIERAQAERLGTLNLCLVHTIAQWLTQCLEAAETPATLSLKWPNDIYLDDQKISGLLLETNHWSAQHCHLVIGVGVNVCGRLHAMPSASIHPQSQDCRAVIETYAQSLAQALVCTFDEHQPLPWSHWIAKSLAYWHQHDRWMHQPVTVVCGTHSPQQQGRYLGVEAGGGFQLHTLAANGLPQVQTLQSAQCQLYPQITS